VHGEGGKQTAKYAPVNQPGQQQQKLASKAQEHQRQISVEKAKLSHKLNPTIQSSIDEKITIAPTTKQAVEQKKGSPRTDGDQQATHSSKPKLTKEVLPEKDDEKRVGAARTLEKLEEVGPSDALKK